MKNIFIILICLFAAGGLRAQVINPADAAKQGATDHVNNNISSDVNTGLDKTEGAIKGFVHRKKKKDTGRQGRP